MAETNEKFPHFKHYPFSLEIDGVRVEVAEDGKIKLTQNHNDDTFDEINTSARLINKLSRMLYVNRTVSFRDEPYKAKK